MMIKVFESSKIVMQNETAILLHVNTKSSNDCNNNPGCSRQTRLWTRWNDPGNLLPQCASKGSFFDFVISCSRLMRCLVSLFVTKKLSGFDILSSSFLCLSNQANFNQEIWNQDCWKHIKGIQIAEKFESESRYPKWTIVDRVKHSVLLKPIDWPRPL